MLAGNSWARVHRHLTEILLVPEAAQKMSDPSLAHAFHMQGGSHGRQAGSTLVASLVVLTLLRPPFVVDEQGSISAMHVAGWASAAVALSFTPICW